MSSYKKSSIIDSFGDTKSSEGAGRRICASKFSYDTKIDELAKFFGSYDRLEGLTLFRKGFAMVQFKKKVDYTIGLSKNGSMFKGAPICVKMYGETEESWRPKSYKTSSRDNDKNGMTTVQRRTSTDHHRGRRSRSRERSQDRRRSRSGTRGNDHRRSRSGGRSRSRSPPPSPERSSEHRNRQVARLPVASPPVVPTPAQASTQAPASSITSQQDFMTSALFNYNIETRSRITTPSVFGGSLAPTTFQANVADKQDPGSVCDLQPSIALLLQYILEVKTSKLLSLVQVRSLLSYFETTQMYLEELNGLPNRHNVSPRPDKNGERTRSSPRDPIPNQVPSTSVSEVNQPTTTPLSHNKTSQPTASQREDNPSSFCNQPPMKTPSGTNSGLSLVNKLKEIQSNNYIK